MDSALLSSRDGYPLEPKSGLNGVKPPVEFGERTRDCSLGHAGKEGPHLAMTGASRGFSQGAVPGWGFSRDRTGSSGRLLCLPLGIFKQGEDRQIIYGKLVPDRAQTYSPCHLHLLTARRRHLFSEHTEHLVQQRLPHPWFL